MSQPAASSGDVTVAAIAEVWEDVTSRLHAAVTTLLKPGELVHHATFSLKDSMSALELGDPKMDATMHVPNNIMTVDKALASGLIVPGAELTPYQMLEVIDELFACEATSFTGTSLAHSLYTCIYLHRLSLLHRECPLLCAYIFLLLKGIEMVRAVIIAADIYTEEDFFYNLSHIKIGDMNVPSNFKSPFSTAIPVASTPAAATSTTAPADKSGELYGGISVEELSLQFTLQEKAIETRLRDLRAAAAAAGTEVVEADLLKPASPDSSELHIFTLLKNRFDYRRAWYHFNLYLRQQPFQLRSTLQRVSSYEAMLNSSLATMLTSIGGSSWKEEEAKRLQTEVVYKKEVADLMAKHEADPTFIPDFPRLPAPYLPPRPLSFGFTSDMTKCITQNSPPRVASILYRRDAVCLLQEFMSHFAVVHQLPAIATNLTFHDIVRWFESFHGLHANILLRSHLWLYMQHSGNKGDATQDPSLDMLAFLQEGAPAERDNVKQMLLKSHMKMCVSIERYATDVLVAEGARRKAGAPPTVWNSATQPFTYSIFLDRCIIPYYNYFKVLLGHPSEYRHKVMNSSTTAEVNLILDWNILMADAQVVDAQDWAPRYMDQENQAVALPAGLTPQQRGSHPSLYFHHNVYSLAMEQLTHMMSSYILFGLEAALYTPKELPVVLWYLEYALDLQIQNRAQRHRDRNELLALRVVKEKKKLGVKTSKQPEHKKLPLPMQVPMLTPPLSAKYLLLEAQQNTARGIIQLLEGLKRLRVTLAGEEVNAVLVPSIDEPLLPTWFSHRFASLHTVTFPAPLHLRDYQRQMSQFDSRLNLTADPILGLAHKSLMRAKETLSSLSVNFAASPALHTRLSPYEAEYVKSLLKVVVSNMMLCLTYTRQMAQASEKQKRWRVEYRWEQQAASPFQTAHSSRLVHFPIVTLAMER